MKSTKKLNSMVDDLYREIYKNSTPPADFDELVKNALYDEWGKKDIKFRNYKIKGSLFDSILKNYFIGKRLTKYEKTLITNTLYFGAIPEFDKDEEN